MAPEIATPPRREVEASETGSPFLPPVGPARRAAAGASGVSAIAPPRFRLPAEHFAAALAFWVMGAIGLVWVAPDIARGHFPLPRVAAVTHLFTLGWITTTILGALYQFLPVALRTPIRSERAAHLTFVLHVPGLALFVTGLLLGANVPMLIGAALFGSGLLLFVWNLSATLKRAPERGLTWWALAGAAGSLALTVVLGASLAGNLQWNHLGAERFLALAVHLHVAVAGWILLVMVGVAHRLLPMFLLSHRAATAPGAAALLLLGSGVGLLMFFHHKLTPAVVWAITAVMMGGGVAFVLQVASFFRASVRPALDPGMRLVAVAIVFLTAAIGVAPFFVASGMDAPRIATAYVVMLILGGISLFVAGHYYKILPFLVWYHRFDPLAGRGDVPRVADLYSAPVATAAGLLLAVGTAALVGATFTGAVPLARPAAVLFAAGALILALQMTSIARKAP